LRDSEGKFRQKGVNIAAVGLGGLRYARQFRDEIRIAFPLLIDDDTEVHKAAGLGKANLLHLLRSDNLRERKRAKSAGHREHNLIKDPFQLEHGFQLGGSFVFGPGNVDRFAHVSRTFSDNASMDDLLNAASV
jgi:hypothetical protein